MGSPDAPCCDGDTAGDGPASAGGDEERTQDPIAAFLLSIGSPGFGTEYDSEVTESDL